jgi:hypothetical protein
LIEKRADDAEGKMKDLEKVLDGRNEKLKKEM